MNYFSYIKKSFPKGKMSVGVESIIRCLFFLMVSSTFNVSAQPVKSANQAKQKISANIPAEDNYVLPGFFDSARVQAHTRMSLEYLRKDSSLFYGLSGYFKGLGVDVFTRHIKSGDEGAWWPSSVGKIEPEAEKVNIAKKIIDEAHRNGQRIIAYHRHMEDDYMAQQHPDWVCRFPDGQAMTKKGIRLCFNSPYADFFLTRSLELADLGVDGFYFDEQHQPKDGCWCPYCRKGFKEKTGLDIPEKIDKDDPLYQKLMDYKNEIMERTFRKYREELHKRTPNLVMLISGYAWPSMTERHTTGSLYRITDVFKTEFSLPVRASKYSFQPFCFPANMHPFEDDVKMAHGWVLARDATGGRPPHVWTHNLLNEKSALFATAALVGHGCIANLDHKEKEIPNQMFRSSYELGKKVSPFLAGTKPYRWIALHFSEYARDQYLGDATAAWRNVLYPHYGAYLALCRERLPVGMITDSQLEDNLLSGYKIVFVSDREKLTEQMKRSIADFEKKRGKVIYNNSEWKWHESEGQQAAIRSFLDEVNKTGVPLMAKVTGGPESMQCDYFLNAAQNQMVITCMNNFSWVSTGDIENIKANDPAKYQEIINRKAPSACRNIRILLQNDLAQKPQKVFDAVSGRNLEYELSGKELSIKLPEFEALAVIVVKY